jgi:signal transduction histidine kinase
VRLPQRLRSRLVLSHLVVALAALGTVLVAVSLVGPGYFADAMGHHPGDPEGEAMDAATLAAFQAAVGTALVAALAIALVAAVVVALALSTRIATPVTRLVDASRRIAAGHYAERVPVAAEGEIGQLAATFNAMAGSLEDTERRRLELVGDVAHELRTPLATLDGYLEGLQDSVVEARPETWSLLRHETGRLTRLVSDLSELWRAEARQLELVIEEVDVTDLAREVLAAVDPVARERGIEVRIDAPSPVRAKADRDRLAQVLGNFLSNAIRYSPPGTSVTLTARHSGTETLVGVRDLGPGLTGEQRARVFERFYRVDPSRSRALGGSGIGLAIARALAEGMGGRVWADSDGPGTGATFWIALRS